MEENERIDELESALYDAYSFLEELPCYPSDLRNTITKALQIEF